MTTAINPLAVGNTVFYFNQWAEFQNDEIRDCFESLTKDQALSLKAGEVVWQDKDNYHPKGKLYGYTAIQITEIEEIDPNKKKIKFDTGFISTELYHNLFKIKDGAEKELLKLIEANPESQPKENPRGSRN